ncbi:hypothetical protein ACP70R_019349 [Stipagrostis hirtigluma subsp. patula]
MAADESAQAAKAQRTVVFVPFPAQGHVTPMLHLARAIAARGGAVAASGEGDDGGGGRVTLAPIPSGVRDDGGDEPPADFAGIVHAMEHHMPAHLEGLLRRNGRGVACLVVDLMASWAIPVAARWGVPAVGFWPVMFASYRAVAAIPELIDKGFISESGTPLPLPANGVNEDEELNEHHEIGDLHVLPSKLELSTNDLPWLVGGAASQKSRFAFWLDRQSPGSVIYVSFGSWVAPIGPDKIAEFAAGLEAAGRPFLWVVKDHPSWRAGLPNKFTETVAGRGKVISWAPQEDVLRHQAVGCYVTHCGWNSTLEAVRHGVRMICYPISGDQLINCAYIVKMWEAGITLVSTDRSDVKDCIDMVMEGEVGRRLQDKVNELREMVMVGDARRIAKRNLDLFVEEIRNDDIKMSLEAETTIRGYVQRESV